MQCKNHPASQVAGACVYCGNFYCADCLIDVKGKMYCKDDIGNVLDETKENAKNSGSGPTVFMNAGGGGGGSSSSSSSSSASAAESSGQHFSNYQNRSKSTALIFCLLGFIGLCGLHRFYTGKSGTGLIWFFTLGIFGIGQIIDLISIITGGFRDNAGQPLT